MIDSRTQFKRTMAFNHPSRVPLLEEGIRADVLDTWRAQGLPADLELGSLFVYDLRYEIYPELGPLPEPSIWPTQVDDLEDFATRFRPNDPGRYPTDRSFKSQIREDSDLIRILRVHRGFFLTAGVSDWSRFKDVLLLAVDQPELIHEILTIQGNFAAQILNEFLAEHQVEAALFSEPIGGNHGPLVSPQMYTDLILPTYQPVFDALKGNGVSTIIWRTYANTRALLPLAVDAGVNCLWACECGTEAMDYQAIRDEFGKALRLIGGIDMDILHGDLDGIRREVETKVPQLLKQGGYLPLLDGRVRKNIAFKKYQFYRHVLEEIVKQ